jgi:hypothetical protein
MKGNRIAGGTKRMTWVSSYRRRKSSLGKKREAGRSRPTRERLTAAGRGFAWREKREKEE